MGNNYCYTIYIHIAYDFNQISSMSEKSKEKQRTSSTSVYRKYTEKTHKHKSVCALKTGLSPLYYTRRKYYPYYKNKKISYIAFNKTK